MTLITSRNNALICECAKLKDKKYREKSGLVVFEGKKLFAEALSCGIEFENVFVTEKGLSLLNYVSDDLPVTLVSQNVYNKLSDDNSPDGIFCVAKQPKNTHIELNECEDFSITSSDFSLFMTVSVRDPGNMGTILRTASALGIDTVVISDDCVDIYNPKTIRSAMGAVFKQKTVKAPNIKKMIKHLNSIGFKTYAAALESDAKILGSFALAPKHCFIAGNEGHGLDADLISECTSAVIIPMMPGNESLNVAGASAILMWESCKNKLN